MQTTEPVILRQTRSVVAVGAAETTSELLLQIVEALQTASEVAVLEADRYCVKLHRVTLAQIRLVVKIGTGSRVLR